MSEYPVGDFSPTRGPYNSPDISEWSNTVPAGGGKLHYHPFKFVDASTTTEVKTKIGSTSELVDVLYPLSVMSITGTEGTGSSYEDAITLTGACYIWLKGTVVAGVCTAAEITTVDPADSELITFDATTPFAQTAFYVLLASVVAGSHPTWAGYDLTIGDDKFHLTQATFNNLRLEHRVVSGRVALIAVTS